MPPQAAAPESVSSLDAMLLLLTWAAGCMDAISYLGLGHVFTAMMTGNTVLLGLAVGQGHGPAAVRSVLALLGFCAGVCAGGLIVRREPRRGAWTALVTHTLTVEAALLAVFAAGWYLSGPVRSEAATAGLILVSGMAMGTQSAAVHHLRVPGVTTTYITGTLTSLMIGVAGQIDGRLGRASDRTGPTREHRLSLLVAVFLTYGVGALVGALLQPHAVLAAAPVLAVALVVLAARVRFPRST